MRELNLKKQNILSIINNLEDLSLKLNGSSRRIRGQLNIYKVELCGQADEQIYVFICYN